MDTTLTQPETATGSHLPSYTGRGGIRHVKGDNGLAYIEVENDFATARIALQGAHLTHWHPRHTAEPVLWLSEHSRHEPGRSIRGGIPLCWPWFGAHPTDSSLCTHGFARVTPFAVVDVGEMDDGYTRIVLEMKQTENVLRQLSYPYLLTITMEIGATLRLRLSTANRATQPFFVGEAFHTYFNIGDVEAVRVSGLDGVEYADKLQNYQRSKQQGDVVFRQEFDRIYVSSTSSVTIHDPKFRRMIVIDKQGSNSTVIWTPWEAKAHQMVDMPSDDGWRNMICVETANAIENLVMINPDHTHVMTVEYTVEELA